MKTPFKDDPDFINEELTKWWKGINYREYQIWYVELKTGDRNIVATKEDKIICVDTNLDSLGCKIDCLILLDNDYT